MTIFSVISLSHYKAVIHLINIYCVTFILGTDFLLPDPLICQGIPF